MAPVLPLFAELVHINTTYNTVVVSFHSPAVRMFPPAHLSNVVIHLHLHKGLTVTPAPQADVSKTSGVEIPETPV